MADRVAPWKLWAAGVVAYLVLVMCFMSEGRTEAAGAAKEDIRQVRAKQEKPMATPALYSVKACGGACHEDGKIPEWVTEDGLHPLVKYVEAKVWKEHDKHGGAFKALEKERGQQMAKLLGYDVTNDKRCLTCHAVWIEDAEERKKKRKSILADGVSCVSCHGAYQEWVTRHQVAGEWKKFRPLSRQEKWVKAGMRDLWDPLQRAELCASCHIGNLEEGKFVTHEMYAAGHPPLPAFELASFSNEMPRHWQYLREKNGKVKAELKYVKGEQEETQLVLVGAAIALREAMNLLIADGTTHDALNWAHFDCYACHHDLKNGDWRRERGYGKGKPGRIQMRPWSADLVRLAIKALPKEAEKLGTQFEDRLKALHAEFDARPFGDAQKVAKAAARMATFADSLATKLNRTERTFTKDQATELLKAIPAVYDFKNGYLDFDTSRAVAWAYEVMHDEIAVPTRPFDLKKLRPEDSDKRLLRHRNADLIKHLSLRLPNKERTLEKGYPALLDLIRDYDPHKGRKLFDPFRLPSSE